MPVGASKLSFYVVVDGVGSATSVSECLDDNNSASVDGVSCPMVN